MTVRLERADDSPVVVAHLEGDVDLMVVPGVRRALDAEIESGAIDIVLDLTAVHYADSSALGLLVWLDRRVEPLGGKVVIANADGNVTRVLEMSGLVGIAPSIGTATSVDEALAGLDRQPAPSQALWTERIVAPAEAEMMRGVRRKVCMLVQRLGMPEASVFDLQVAVGEALANAVRHGSPRGAEDYVEVEVTGYADRAVVSVKDCGTGYSGETSEDGDVFAAGGRGVLFMSALTDGMEFTSLPGEEGTVVRLTKRVAPHSEGKLAGADA